MCDYPDLLQDQQFAMARPSIEFRHQTSKLRLIWYQNQLDM